jgi:hypothetical protein
LPNGPLIGELLGSIAANLKNKFFIKQYRNTSYSVPVTGLIFFYFYMASSGPELKQDCFLTISGVSEAKKKTFLIFLSVLDASLT